MVRLGLSIYLTLATAAGPWPCCCTVRWLVQEIAPAAAEQAREESGCPCCCHPPPQKEPTRRDRSEYPPCPCREQRGESAPALPPGGSLVKHLPGGDGPLPALCQPAAELSLAAPAAAPQGRRVLPFWTSLDILHTLHILRC